MVTKFGSKINSKAVTPLLGFVLILAIIMGFIGLLQSYAVPQWNKGVEVQHLDRLSYEVSEISEVVALSATTGGKSKIVLEGGVKYPPRPFLISPMQSSTTIQAKELKVSMGSNNFSSYAIVVIPNYFYLSRPALIYEHSAVFEKYYKQIPAVKSNQSSFSPGKISLYLINTSMSTISSTEPINLIFEPVSYGGIVHKDSVTITFESYDNATAEWWNRTINSIPGFTASRTGNRVTVTATDVDLSITEIIAYATSAGEVSGTVSPSPSHLINLSDGSYTVYAGTTIPLGVRVVDKLGNPVPGASVSIDINPNTPSNPDDSRVSDEKGEVWYYFNADSAGSYTVTFSIPLDSYTYSIMVSSLPGANGGGCIFNAYWLEGDSLIWNTTQEGTNKKLNFSVKYGSDSVYNAQVYFAITNTSVVSANSYEAKTDASGIAQINLTALNNGSASVFGIVASCVDVINLTVEGYASNHPPTPPTLTTDKDRYYSGETITATANGSADPDGDPITYYYKFYDYAKGSVLQDWSTDNTYIITTSEEGHVIRVYAKACDGKGACSNEVYRDVGVIKVVTLNPSDDAYVNSLYLFRNFGSNTSLHVAHSPGSMEVIERTYVRFNLSSIPAGSHIVSASLKLYKYYTTASNRNYGAHRVNGAWSESSITWNNQPAFNSVPTDTVNPGSGSGLVSWDVTSDVQDFVNGTANNYGWCIKDEKEKGSFFTYFYSRDYGNSDYWPQLVVEYSPI